MRIGILTKNTSDKLRDVGDINAKALYENLKKLGFKVDLIYYRSDKNPDKGELHILKGLLKHYDIIYASSPKRYFGIACIFFSILHFKPLYISIFDSTLEPIRRGFGGFIFRILAKLKFVILFSVSNFQKKLIKKKLRLNTPVLPPCLLTFGYNKTHKPSEKPTVLFAGSTNNKKRGLDIILDACQIVSQKIPELKLVILNKFSKEERRTFANQKSYNFDVINKKFVKNMDKEYRQAWIYTLVFEKKKYIPPIPFTFLEAMSFGAPVITSHFEEFKEIIPESQMVEPENPKELAAKMLSVIKNRKRVRIDKKYFPKEVAKKFIKLTLS